MSDRVKPIVIDMPAPAEFSSPRTTLVSSWPDRVLLIGLIAISIWAPLAFGTTEVWSQFLYRVLVLTLFCVWITKQSLQGQVEIPQSPIAWPVLGFGGLIIVQLSFGLTAYRHATVSEAINIATYGAMMLIASDLFVRRRQLRAFALCMGVYGGLLALVSILLGFSGTVRIYGIRDVTAKSAEIFGPYANHNHYAGLMELLTPLAVAAAFLETGARRSLLLFASMLMAISVVFSRSRGGMIAMLTAAIFVCIFLYRVFGQRRGLLLMAGVFGVIVAFALLLSNDKMLSRVSETQDSYRIPIAIDTLHMIAQKPFIGFGLGTFADAYPRFQSFFSTLLVNHAHNDYLELAAETGLVGLALVLWMLFAAFRSATKKIAVAADSEGRLLTMATMTGMVALLVHSAFDFNLHIPANASLFFILCSAIAVPFRHQIKPIEVQVFSRDEEEDE